MIQGYTPPPNFCNAELTCFNATQHPSHISLFTKKTLIRLKTKSTSFPSRNTLNVNTTSWDGIYQYDTRATESIPQKVGRSVHQIQSCTAFWMESLLRRRGGYLPLTEYGKHPFRLVTRALGGKRD